MTSSNDIRAGFLDYFKQRGYEVAPSSSLVPANDPTLLFTNAGMVQFKEAFLGGEQRACPRAATAQRCLRAGGKHNDLENVGRTARHHTFFEMLGNFSFGDYFKEEAIGYAWDFLRRELALPEEKLWVTVYQDDDEAARIWLQELGVAESRFSRCGEADNFWSMGETGPCGPCSEIFYDYGEETPGGPPGSADADGDRFVEIWNLVFMQFDRDHQGRLQPLPKPSVDTGMGLERIAAVLQGVRNNYETDLFQPLTRAVHDLAGGRATEPVLGGISGSKSTTFTEVSLLSSHRPPLPAVRGEGDRAVVAPRRFPVGPNLRPCGRDARAPRLSLRGGAFLGTQEAPRARRVP